MKALDRIDRRIITELDGNARQSFSSLSKTIRQGRDKVEYRAARLKEEKIIRKYTVAVDWGRLGYSIFKTYLQLENNKEEVTKFISHLRKHSDVFWVGECVGSWDVMFTAFAKNQANFFELQSKILSEYTKIILTFTNYTLVNIRMYKKSFLINKAKGYLELAPSTKLIQIDSLDKKILTALSKDARASYKQIAAKTNSSPSSIRYRIERMEREKLIMGYTTELDIQKLDLMHFKAQLFLRSYDLESINKMRDYCDKNPYITQFIRQLGDCTHEVEIVANNYAHYNLIIDEMRAEFSKLIRNTKTVMFRKIRRKWVTR